MTVRTIPTLKDNLSYILHASGSDEAVVIDPSEAAPVLAALERYSLRAVLILNTHHHHDHIGGNSELIRRYGIPVWCSNRDLERVPGAVRGLFDGEELHVAKLRFRVLSIPGHTEGQIAFHFEDDHSIFVGDTLFSLGCGRLFEGTASELWKSLRKISSLPPETQIYFGHEYTERNARFTLSFFPDDVRILERMRKTAHEIADHRVATAPTIADEKTLNLFLDPARAKVSLGLPPSATDLEVFTELRRRRDVF